MNCPEKRDLEARGQMLFNDSDAFSTMKNFNEEVES